MNRTRAFFQAWRTFISYRDNDEYTQGWTIRDNQSSFLPKFFISTIVFPYNRLEHRGLTATVSTLKITKEIFGQVLLSRKLLHFFKARVRKCFSRSRPFLHWAELPSTESLRMHAGRPLAPVDFESPFPSSAYTISSWYHKCRLDKSAPTRYQWSLR